MSKSADEQATEIVAAMLSTEKGLAYLSPVSDEVGTKIAAAWKTIYETILDRRTTRN